MIGFRPIMHNVHETIREMSGHPCYMLAKIPLDLLRAA